MRRIKKNIMYLFGKLLRNIFSEEFRPLHFHCGILATGCHCFDLESFISISNNIIN